MRLLFLLFLAIDLATPAPRSSPRDHGETQIADSVAVRRDAEGKVRAFLTEWRGAWMLSDSARMRSHFYDRSLAMRNVHAHCHAPYGKPTSDEEAYTIREHYAPIRSAGRAQARCPSWILGATGAMADEADVIDGALLEGLQEQVREERQFLIADLDSAQRLLPGDGWIQGQRIRFLLDAGRHDDAVKATRDCHADRWWCAALAGFTYYQLHAIAAADSAFASAQAAMIPDARCAWSDIRALLPREQKEDEAAYTAYVASNCGERAHVNERYWWLAKPLLTNTLNERRVAQDARRVLLLLHQATERDERYRWAKEFGGDAVTEMILRYGWPSVSVRIGREQDRNHDDYLKSHGAKATAPYATAEYSSNRYHFGASSSALADPFHATDADWQLVAPPSMSTTAYAADAVWWPVEHYRFDAGVMVPLPAGQVALFRRQHAVQLAHAIDVRGSAATTLQPWMDEPVAAALAVSPAPDVVHTVASTNARFTGRIRMMGSMPARPSIVGLELSGGSAPRMFARTRHGVTPPAVLADLSSGTIAVSDPVFFAPEANGELPADLDAMLPRMLGSTSVPRSTKVGVFWEAYGIAPGDSVRIAVSVTPESGPSLLRRLGAALRIVDASMSGIAVAWQDPRSREPGVAGASLVPILPRSVVLDLSELPEGSYQIEVTVTTPGREAARAHRSLVLN